MESNQQGDDTGEASPSGGRPDNSSGLESLLSLETRRALARERNDSATVAKLDELIKIKMSQAKASFVRTQAEIRQHQQRRRDTDTALSDEVSTAPADQSSPLEGHAEGTAPDTQHEQGEMFVSLYLDTDDAVTTLNTVAAIQGLVRELGYSTPIITGVERGSVKTWLVAAWNSTKGKTARAASRAKTNEVRAELERLGRLKVEDFQADVDGKNVDSVVKLAASYAEVEGVAVLLGAILFLKYRASNGTSVATCRILSTREIDVYRRTPSLCSDPAMVEQNLAFLVAEDGQEEIET